MNNWHTGHYFSAPQGAHVRQTIYFMYIKSTAPFYYLKGALMWPELIGALKDRGFKTFFMLSSAETKIYPAH